MISNIIRKLRWNKKLKILRTLKEWTQEKAADECCTTPKVYWSWEMGKNYPRKNSKKAIARAFSVTVDEIFGEEVEKNKNL